LPDKTAHCCVELFHKAQRDTEDDFPHYDVLQNILARTTIQVLTTCFGNDSDNVMHYADDLAKVMRDHIDAAMPADQSNKMH